MDFTIKIWYSNQEIDKLGVYSINTLVKHLSINMYKGDAIGLKESFISAGKAYSGFYDMHTHILPGLDDGAANIQETMKMLSLAYEEGIRRICATPHYNVEKTASLEERVAAFRRIQQKIKEVYSDMELYLGNELMYSYDIAEHLRKGQALTLNGSKYVLVEFMPSATYKHVLSGFQALISSGYRPVLAHMERMDCLWKERERLDELKEISVIFQMNTESLIGSRFNSEVKYCRKLIKEDYIDILGSDMHRVSWRPPVYQKAAQWIAKECGKDKLMELTVKNPAAILKNENLT